MLRLSEITIHQFRSVVSGTTIKFGRNSNVLLGKTGTGKTTLLRLIESLVTSNLEWLNEEKVHVSFVFDYGYLEMGDNPREVLISASVEICSAPVKSQACVLDSDVRICSLGLVDANSFIRVTMESNGTEYRVEQRGGVVQVFVDGKKQVEALSHDFSLASTMWFLHTHILGHDIEAWVNPVARLAFSVFLCKWDLRRFDEALDLFDTITKPGDPTTTLVLHHEPDMDRLLRGPGFVPIDILAKAVSLASWEAPPATLSLKGVQLVEHAVRLLGFKDGVLDLVLEKKSPEENQLRYDEMRFSFTRADRTVIGHKALSYGQKRTLTFLYLLECSHDAMVIADELVNGLHYDWIRACLQQIGSRQAFLSSRNPLLLDCLEFESGLQARQTFVICELDDHHGMVWRNLNDEESDSFFRAYQTGIQQVGAILQTRGLWGVDCGVDIEDLYVDSCPFGGWCKHSQNLACP